MTGRAHCQRQIAFLKIFKMFTSLVTWARGKAERERLDHNLYPAKARAQWLVQCLITRGLCQHQHRCSATRNATYITVMKNFTCRRNSPMLHEIY